MGDTIDDVGLHAMAVFKKLQGDLNAILSKGSRHGGELTGIDIKFGKLLDVIGSHEDSVELQKELKDALIEMYWNGFYKGYSNGKL